MQARVFVTASAAVLAAGLSLTGCTSGGGKHTPASSSSSGATVATGRVGGSATSTGTPDVLGEGSTANLHGFCAKLVAAGLKLNAAQTGLYDGGNADALTTIIAELDALKKDAPADVRSALDDMRSAFQSAQQMLAHNNVTQASSEFAKIGPRLEKDDTVISRYTASKCASS